MAQRVRPVAAYGSLLKGAKDAPSKGGKPAGRAKAPRKDPERNDEHLEAIRQCPCVSCGRDPANEAAHLRMTSNEHSKQNAMGKKPGDRWTTPLCHACHMSQHQIGETPFWANVGIDPFTLAHRLHGASPNVEAMRAMCFVAYELSKQT